MVHDPSALLDAARAAGPRLRAEPPQASTLTEKVPVLLSETNPPNARCMTSAQYGKYQSRRGPVHPETGPRRCFDRLETLGKEQLGQTGDRLIGRRRTASLRERWQLRGLPAASHKAGQGQVEIPHLSVGCSTRESAKGGSCGNSRQPQRQRHRPSLLPSARPPLCPWESLRRISNALI